MMRSPRLITAAIVFGAAIWSGFWLRAQQIDAREISSFFPPGALLYLEAKDFRHLLGEWNSSAEKKSWLQSDNFGVLSRSRLVQRLGEAQDQFATVAGLPIEFHLLDEVAGVRSAFAFYDLPNLSFVYLTKLESSRLNASQLWKTRAKYQPRSVAGIPFYVSFDASTHRTVAMADYQDWLVITTSEEHMAQTLALLSGAKAGSLSTEVWFKNVTAAAAKQGDLRLIYNLDTLLPTAQFRTYWIQSNATDLKRFASGLADLFELPNGFEEQRVMLRPNGEPAPPAPPSIDAVMQYAPQDSSLYRAWALPNRDLLTQVLEQVVFTEPAQTAGLDRIAPTVPAEAAPVGSVSDFETRIDEPPFRRQAGTSIAALVNVLIAMKPAALLHVQSTTVLGDNVFVTPQSGAAIACERPDLDAFRKSLSNVADSLVTGSLDPLRVSLSGNTILITRLDMPRSTISPQVPAGVTYAARFNKQYEWPHFKKLFGVIDRNSANPEVTASQATPTFFSGNVRSLGDAMSRLDHVSVVAQEGAELRETVRYQMSAP